MSKEEIRISYVQKESKNKKIYWFKQSLLILLLFFLAFSIDIFMKNTNSLLSIDSIMVKKVIFLFISTIIFYICNLFLYNYSSVNLNFMKHSIWDKMFVIIFGGLIIAFIIFIILFITTPFSDILHNQLWMLYFIIFFFSFFLNLFVLSFIHAFFLKSENTKQKIKVTWITSTILMALFIFLMM